MAVTKSRLAPPLDLTSSSGMRAAFSSSGGLRRLEVDGLSLLLYPATELEPGPGNIYLRVRSGSNQAHALLAPQSGSDIRWTVAGPAVSGRWQDLEYRATFRLAAALTAWFWHVELINRSSRPMEVDLLYSHDVALTPYEVVRINEYYVSQYLDLTPVQTRTGTAVGVRQNMPGPSAPWVLLGSLGEGVGWGTDSLQLAGDRAAAEPGGLLADRLPSARLQHEHTLVLLQDRPWKLEPGARAKSGFFGIYRSDQPAATAPDDAQHALEALRQPEAAAPEVEPDSAATQAVPSLFAPVALLQCGDISEQEIGKLAGSARRHLEAEGRNWFSFFGDDSAYVASRAKERALLRPHGQILRTGDRLLLDEGSLTSTAWMAGVFHSQVTQGHVALNRLISTRRGYVNPGRAQGIRVFIEAAPDSWALLDEPSAWAASPDSCRWWYRHAHGLIEVVATAPAANHELLLRLRVIEGEPCRLLLCARVALGDDDGEGDDPLLLSADETGVTVRPPADSAIARRFPDGSFRLSWSEAAIEEIRGDEPLFLDGRSRQLPWVTVRTAPTSDFAVTLTANLVPVADRARQALGDPAWPDFWEGLNESIQLFAPPTSRLSEEIQRLDAVLPWFAHDALVHYLSPRGLEQYTGGAWGTRDVCQGPVSLLIALDQLSPIRDVLLRVFRAQNARGDWPQWFEFFPRELVPGQREAHGDVIFWPLLALAEYINASGDGGLLDEPVAFVADQGFTGPDPVLEHLRRALRKIAADTLPGTTLPAYGQGDWNDSLRPAHPELAARLCSTWTVTLQVQTLRTLASALRSLAASGDSSDARRSMADQAEQIASASAKSMRDLLLRDGVLAGYGLFGEDGSVEHLVHPADRRTGLHYGVLQMISAITTDLLSRDEATAHLELIEKYLTGPDGTRLFDRPVQYRGGAMEVFQRAEAATFFGREIGLMYMHAHLRYAEALARFGDGRRLFQALALANPIGVGTRIATARTRQSNCYYTSSDAVFADRYQAADEYEGIMRGQVPLEGGWRVYSSGPGIFLRLIVECLLGLRRRPNVLEIDPVLTAELDGLGARLPVAGIPVNVIFRVGRQGLGVNGVSLNGERLRTSQLENPYRRAGVAIDMGRIRSLLRRQENTLEIDVP
jgi:cellobiose phosphorylase